MAHLLRYDSNLGPFEGEVRVSDGALHAAGEDVKMLSERDPRRFPGASSASTSSSSRPGSSPTARARETPRRGGEEGRHLRARQDPDITVVLGVNDGEYDPDTHHIVSNASCTTNCVAPLARWCTSSAETGFMTTIHAYTNDQVILDFPHRTAPRAGGRHQPDPDLLPGRRRRSGSSSGAPGEGGRDRGAHPVATGSLTGCVVRLGRDTSVEEVNEAYRAAAGDPAGGILQYTEDLIVSTDINGNPYSCIFDSELTMAHGNFVKVFGWYDNEWGYSCRCVDLIGRMLPA